MGAFGGNSGGSRGGLRIPEASRSGSGDEAAEDVDPPVVTTVAGGRADRWEREAEG